MTNIHPKVAWPALVTPLVALVEAILAWQHVNIPVPVQIPAVTLVYLIAGYLAPNTPPVAPTVTVAPAPVTTATALFSTAPTAGTIPVPAPVPAPVQPDLPRGA